VDNFRCIAAFPKKITFSFFPSHGNIFLMELKATASARKILNLQSSSKTVKKIVRGGLNLLEKYFGADILLEIPDHLQGVEAGMLPVINTTFELKRLGLIEEIREIPKLPDEPFVHITTAIRANSGGADFFSREKSYWRALGETVERYLWRNSDFFYRQTLTKKFYSEIKNESVNIFELAGFSNEQKKNIDTLKFDRKTVFGWIPARLIASGKKIWCPAQLFSLRYFRENVEINGSKNRNEPMLRWAVTTGIATGQSLEEALVKGILEVVERDAFMISYLNKLSPPILDLDSLAEQDSDLEKILKNFRRYNLEVHLLQLFTDFPVNVYLAIVIDRTGLGPALSAGASADFDLKACLLDGLAEALNVRLNLKKSFREETGPSEKLDRHGRLLWWAKGENIPKINFFLRGEKTKLNLEKEISIFSEQSKESSRRKYYKEKLDLLKKYLQEKKCEAVYAELTDPDIMKLGFRSVQVVIPELQPMHLNESIPYFGGKRLKEIPQRFGYKPAEELNEVPHPFP
jgi:ribosomal protein S12 methylthiotransferase accessory factor